MERSETANLDPSIRLAQTTWLNIALRESTTKEKRNDDNGYPCLSPLDAYNKFWCMHL